MEAHRPTAELCMNSIIDAAADAPPIGEAEVQQLKSWLDDHALPQGGMSLEMVDGLFSGLQVAPQDLPAEAVLPLLFGSAPPYPAAIERLLGQLWRHIEQRLAIDPDGERGTFMPLLSFPGGLPEGSALGEWLARFEFPLGAAWAGGFLHAVRLAVDDWNRRQQRLPAWEVGLRHLLRLVQLEADAAGNTPPSAEERFGLMASMPYLLRRLAADRAAQLK